MNEATATTREPADVDTSPTVEAFQDLERLLRESGPKETVDHLVLRLNETAQYRALLDALLLRARLELGLPLILINGFADIPEALRAAYEERYVEAIREVGGKLLETGDISAAWPYFRAIGETEPVKLAIEAYEASENDERLNAVVEVAFNQGAHPRKGFELILKHYGTCSAITAFEHLPREGDARAYCVGLLTRQMHEHLAANLRAEISHRGQPLPPEGSTIATLVHGRDWLFADEAYHIDVSHLSSTVRVAPLSTDPEVLRLAADLTEYGRRLSGRHRYEGDPPFEDIYEDHRVYLKALLGEEVEAAIAHFQSKLTAEPDASDGFERGPSDKAPAQILVGMLARLGRLNEAIDIAEEHLAGIPDAALFCPGIPQLCREASRPDRLAKIARERGDLVNYATAILLSHASPS